ncbi:DNA-binding anti-repressor SinI [Halobacillus halophilus]|uniref:anti-repressor SinI family protein n=1 Tax=Halobacillus halophilus TaxID=1570 RepID=UPI00136F330A|nr:anti-repressor SinI family protein [Halobacillus halophilus]MYL30810.1 DNA-binding anti-repressor SinI [Halobacillus halophilus]
MSKRNGRDPSLDEEWERLVLKAMDSGCTKEEFRRFLRLKKAKMDEHPIQLRNFSKEKKE